MTIRSSASCIVTETTPSSLNTAASNSLLSNNASSIRSKVNNSNFSSPLPTPTAKDSSKISAPKPTDSTVSTRTRELHWAASKATRAVFDVNTTVTLCTPGTCFRQRSTVSTHTTHVIPSSPSSSCTELLEGSASDFGDILVKLVEQALECAEFANGEASGHVNRRSTI